ncbi:MAG: 1-acyl-sn-glycerol-3-phosphate acyltransferase [Clostridia bacterium]|nr:1-acyl-sn-glycerol-3-phosphate acyltransferase [Clostridia bacterium]
MNSKEKKKNKRKKYRTFSIKRFFYDFVKWTGALPMMIFFRMKIYRIGKKEKFKGALMMSNHIGLLDPVIIQFVYPFRRLWCLAMKELFTSVPLKLFLKGVNCIPVDRENVTIDMYHSVADVLSSGKIVAMFPEGRINFDKEAEVKSFKGGAALFAILNKVPVIPVYIVKKTKKLERQKVVVGEIIHLENICGKAPTVADLETVSQYLHQKEQELEQYYLNNIKKEKTNGNQV